MYIIILYYALTSSLVCRQLHTELPVLVSRETTINIRYWIGRGLQPVW